MKVYLLSLGAGVLVGVIYSLINVRSPAPPLIALLGLLGLLGMLGGEQVIPVAKRLLSGTTLSAAWHDAHCTSHVFGMLPGRQASEQARRATTDTEENRS
jgi:XapX domain-containing protein